MKIALIGAGISGVCILNNLLSNSNRKKFSITIFDQIKYLGTGRVFGSYDSECYINTSTGRLETIFNNSTNFSDWLNERMINIYDEDNDPIKRSIFGIFSREVLSEQLRIANEKNIQVIFNNSYIKEVSPLNSGFQIVPDEVISKQSHVYDVVIVATGSKVKINPWKLPDTPYYIDQPYPINDLLSKVKAVDNIAILGTGLTSVDIAFAINNAFPEKKLSMVSKSGKLPQTQIISKNLIDKCDNQSLNKHNINNLYHARMLNAINLLALIEKELSMFGYEDIQSIYKIVPELSSIRCHQFLTKTNSIINYGFSLLDMKEKYIFRSYFDSSWNKFRVRMPLASSKRINRMISSKNLDIISGLDNIVVERNSLLVQASVTKVFDIGINASGIETRLSKISPLETLSNKLLLVDDFERGIVDYPSCQAISHKNKIIPGLYFIGSAAAGTFFMTSALDVIAEQADKICTSILNSMR